NAGTVCRPAAGDCDVAETCTGTSPTCPTDRFAPTTQRCRDAAGECDVAEFCTGASATCPNDVKAAAGTACTSDTNNCTLDQCDGTSVPCTHPSSGQCVCGNGRIDIDAGETCDEGTANGTTGSCCTNGCTLRAANTMCRAAAGACDVPETCTGTSPTCPTD